MILLDKFQDDAAPIPNAFESTSQRVNEQRRDTNMIDKSLYKNDEIIF